ncbi:MAG: flagellar biosynthesis protein FlhA [Nitrospirae bacterium]|nr:flagellar biosynthesis protein FlhA [Nitrospirota bacterium]
MADARTDAIANPGLMTLQGVMRHTDVLLAVGVVGLLIVMIVPLPTFLLDLLLTLSITFSVVILLVSMYTLRPLEFSVFPTVLLLATLLRLSLNVASTRLILLHGNEGTAAAGKVIQAFGQFVVGGNYAVGIVVFAILSVINFVVITKGAGRIAEVAARFTLDAMPGKQMAIDADLNAGLVDEAEARRRRSVISREADFYGAMDGASKFVRGDAVAGIIIALVNIVGGLFVGVIQQGLDVKTAAQTYTILTIGDGLVAQIPALVVSTAAGMIVTRAASEANLGQEMAGQLFVHPKALGSAAGILAFFGVIPGLPHIAFLTMAALAGAGAFGLIAMRRREEAREAEEEARRAVPAPAPEKADTVAPLDPIELEVGYGLIPLVDAEQNGDLLDRIRAIRRQLAVELGMVVPSLHIRDNLQLKPAQYSLLIRGNEVGGGEVVAHHYLAMDPGTASGPIEGIPTKDPAFGLPAHWVPEADKERAQFMGYTVVDPSTVVATHLTELLKSHAHELLGRQEAQKLLDGLAKTHPKVVEDVVPALLPLGVVVRVMQNLLRERVPVRDLATILETLADFASITKDSDTLTEYVRQALYRTITRQYTGSDGSLPLLTLDPRIEERIAQAVQGTHPGSYLTLDPGFFQRLMGAIRPAVESVVQRGYTPILLCSPVIRSAMKRLTERFLPNLVILSHNEIANHVRIQSIGTVRWSDAA